jgi:hypothetical protein
MKRFEFVALALIVVTIGSLSWLVQRMPPPPLASSPLESRSRTNGEVFAGNDREIAKTSIALAEVQPFSDLAALLASLPSDDFMRTQHQPPIQKDSGRVKDEERNVRVPAFIVATKKETDNDFHMILGSAANGGGPYMTAEVSGLARTGPEQHRQNLSVARDHYRAIIKRIPGAKYEVVKPPISVTVTGSLFYDIDHPPGAVGTGRFVPATSWEVHPVTAIVGR